MAQWGGPWRLAGSELSNRQVTGKAGAARPLPTCGSDRVLRWIAAGYVLAVVGGGVVALVGLRAGWW
jgi:hypothetical protein